MTRPRRWRRSHILKRVPPTSRYAESGQVPKIFALFRPAAKDIHDVPNDSCGVALTGRGYETYAFLGRPRVCPRVISPNVIKPVHSIGASKSIKS